MYKASMGKSHDRVNVEKATFLAHTFHFLLSAAKACLFPFLTIYFRLLGLSATQVGLIFAAQAFMRLWCAPMWTACAKACRKKKFVLMCSTFILLVSTLSLSLAPPSDPDHSKLYCRSSHGNSGEGISETTGNSTNWNSSNNASGVNETSQPPLMEGIDYGTNTTNKGEIPVNEVTTEIMKVTDENKKPITTSTTTTVSGPSTTSVVVTTTPQSTTTTETITSTVHQGSKLKSESTEEDSDEEIAKLAKLDKFAHNLVAHGITSEMLEELSDDEINELLRIFEEEESADLHNSEDQNNRKSKHKHSGHKEQTSDTRGKSHQKRSAFENTVTNFRSTWKEFSENLEKQEYRTFVFVLVLIIASELLAAPVEKLADDCWFEYLDILDVLEKYGNHRAWQLVGYMLLPVFVGTIVEKTHCTLIHSIPHFMIHFFMFAGFAVLAFIVAFGYPMSQNKKTPKQSRFAKGVRILCCDPHSMTMTFTIFMLGTMYACLQNFLFWKVQDVGGSDIVLGTSVVVAATSALFIYVIGNALIKRISHVGAVVLAMITLACRLVFYSFLWTPWLVLAGEALHGFSYTLLWRAVEMYPDFRINPFVMDRSAFTLLNAIYHGLGLGIGSALSGYLYDQVGFALLFQGACVAITAWCAMFLLLQKCIKRKMRVRYAKLLQDDRGDNDSSSEEEDWLEVAMKSGSK